MHTHSTTHTHAHTHSHTHAHVHTSTSTSTQRMHTHTHTHTRTHAHAHARTRTHKHKHTTHARTHTCTHAHTHTHVHTSTSTQCMHTHTHTCTHAHARTQVERADIRTAMIFALDCADAGAEIVETLADALSLPETPVPLKIARYEPAARCPCPWAVCAPPSKGASHHHLWPSLPLATTAPSAFAAACAARAECGHPAKARGVRGGACWRRTAFSVQSLARGQVLAQHRMRAVHTAGIHASNPPRGSSPRLTIHACAHLHARARTTRRLFLVCDILHNSTAPVRNASSYRTRFEGVLPAIFDSLHEAYKCVGRERTRACACVRACVRMRMRLCASGAGPEEPRVAGRMWCTGLAHTLCVPQPRASEYGASGQSVRTVPCTFP